VTKDVAESFLLASVVDMKQDNSIVRSESKVDGYMVNSYGGCVVS
jgi:hypothetical protein